MDVTNFEIRENLTSVKSSYYTIEAICKEAKPYDLIIQMFGDDVVAEYGCINKSGIILSVEFWRDISIPREIINQHKNHKFHLNYVN